MRNLTPDETCALTAGAAMWSTLAVPEAGIPAFTMADGPMGIASGNVDERDVSLLTPCPTALGASWDVELCAQVGRVVGSDAVARGVDAVLAPNLNLARSPLAGRAFEYFSEEPVLAGLLGAGWIAGLQSTGTGSVAKHLVCNDSETERDRVDVRVDEATLREVYLLPFRMAARAGCVAMLAAYNKVNGQWCSESAHVITDILKGEWGFPGLVMSDWFGTHSGAGALNAGLDLEMPGPARVMGAKLAPQLADGSVTAERLNDAAARVAHTARAATGAKQPPLAPEAAQDILTQAAAAGFVLLRNEGGLLPIAPGSVKRLAIIGPNAAAPCYQGGTFAKIALAPDTPTPIEAIRARYGDSCEIVFEAGVDPQPRLPSMPVSPAIDIGDGCIAGMTLEYFASPDCSGQPLTRETRATNSLVWFVGVHDQSRFDQPGSVRASGLFRAEHTGPHRLYLGSTGQARVLVDGIEVLAAGGEVPASDVMGKLKAGDADSIAIDLVAGQQAHITVEFRHGGARVHGLWYGLRRPDSPEAMLERAVAAARNADAVVLVIGETSDSSVESKDRPDTHLPAGQLALIEAVCAANPRVAIVSNVGHAFDCAWEEKAAAHMVAWYPGQGFAPALAAVLAGDAEPGGRMPVSIAMQESDYPALAPIPDANGHLPYAEGVLPGYRGLIAAGKAARHSLGAGQGYTTFEWSDARLEQDGVSVLLRNTGTRPGAEVVQVYAHVPHTVLAGFAKAHLAPGEERRVQVAIEPLALERWQEGAMVRPASVALRVARHAEDEGMTLTL
ncbi:MAG TPA: glycoside hydrolase family 3 C-terminal domain-containing protein [Novosphingobium sp.]|nr:glycoside hydrolase family 3 C-terminal domain-containing protein [Novosphingobium sp.]